MGGGRLGDVALRGEPELLAPRSLPGHRILTLTLRNPGPREVMLPSGALVLFGDDGDSLRATVTFQRDRVEPGNLIGAKRAVLAPEGSVDVILVWHDAEAVRLAYPGGEVPLVTPPRDR
jgi:hypothetical protein